MRGDSATASVGLRRGTARHGLTHVGRGKMLDNLRRSAMAPFTLLALRSCWLLPMPAALIGTLLVVACVAVPAFLPILFALLPGRPGMRLRSHLTRLRADMWLASAQTLLFLTFLPDHAWRAADAAIRTLFRLMMTHRHLLEWTTAAKSSAGPAAGPLPASTSRWPAARRSPLLAAGALSSCRPPGRWSCSPLCSGSAPRRSRNGRAVRRKCRPASPSVNGKHATCGSSPAHPAFLETFVTPAEQHAAAGQFPGSAEADCRAPDLADQYWPLSALDHRRPRLRLRPARSRPSSGSKQRSPPWKRLPRFRGHFFNWYGTENPRIIAA